MASTRGSRRSMALRLCRIREELLRDAVVELLHHSRAADGYLGEHPASIVRTLDLAHLRDLLTKPPIPMTTGETTVDVDDTPRPPMTVTERMELDAKAAIETLFTYHPPSSEQAVKYHVIREAGKELAKAIYLACEGGPDRTAAIRKVREAVMTANASIATHNAAKDVR